ncbi:MAG: hypothetical protein ABSA90_06970 [Xanthobacteraceae bacterium]|jgi:hypothetical protein
MSSVEKTLQDAAERSARAYKEDSTNPWAATPENCDARTGRYREGAISRQMSCVRALGPEKSAQISAAVSAKLGDLYAPGYTNRGR